MEFFADLKARRIARREAQQEWKSYEAQARSRIAQGRALMSIAIDAEKVVAKGSVAVYDRYGHVLDSNRFVLTATRLLWNSGNDQEVRTIELTDVETFTLNGAWSPERIQLRLLGGTTLVFGFVAAPPSGQLGTVFFQRDFLEKLKVQLELAGARRSTV
jgi:hypothetical protein